MTRWNLFTIPPGAPFLKVLAARLCDGTLIEGFRHRAGDPLSLASVIIYVPTRRAARALRSEFVDLLPAPSAILPVIRPLGDYDEDAGFFDETIAREDLAPPVGQTERLLELANLILAWKRRLPQAVAEVHGDHPLLAPASPADAVWLARSLAELLDSMETEDRSWSALSDISSEDHARWWQLSLEFLKIASAFWPQRLVELDRSSAAAHRNVVLRAEAERLKSAPRDGPVIIAGSTGSIPATAELMRTVAGLERGAVVLPGLDFNISNTVWPLVGGATSDGYFDPAICAHPQYGLFALLAKLEAGRDDVKSLAEPDADMAVRNRIVSTALLPAEATQSWVESDLTASEIAAACRRIELIEAANEREEALAIATAMRLSAEPDADSAPRNVALVTPDRNLARRVSAELRRFGIEADDSGGKSLSLTQPAAICRLILAACCRPQDPIALLSLLKHPLARFGGTAGDARRNARLFERIALRDAKFPVETASIVAAFDLRLAERRAEARYAPFWWRRLTEADFQRCRAFVETVETALAPLTGVKTALPVAEWVGKTIEALEAVAANERGDLSDLWSGEAGERLYGLLAEMLEDRSGLACSAYEWAGMTPALLSGEMVKPRAGGHPHVFIWGSLEARLQPVDTLIMAGLNEGTWPGQTSTDPFLSRSMMTEIGLEPPERRIGLAAHDFQMNLGAPHVILSRSARSANAPTVPSRWLQRLLAIVGDDAAMAMRARGGRFIQWANDLDLADDTPLAARPAPKPPANLQPKRYSFSEVQKLRRDPYAIYARRVLRLDPPEELGLEPGPAERGTLYHGIAEQFAAVAGLDDAEDRLREIWTQAFDKAGLPAHIRIIWQTEFERIAGPLIKWERDRAADIATRHTEIRAAYDIEACGVLLTGIADRIDIRHDGTVDIIDFKTGASPSRKVAWTLLDPQLPLEGAALMAGAFAGVGRLDPEHRIYVRLRPDDNFKAEYVDGAVRGYPDAKSATDRATESLSRFTDLVNALARGELGFASQVIPDAIAQYGREYDHLARVQEWSILEDGQNGDGEA